MSTNKGKRPSQDMEKPAKRINNTSEQANDNAAQQQQLKAESGPSAQDNNKGELHMESQDELARMEEKLSFLDPEISQLEDTLRDIFKFIEQMRNRGLFAGHGQLGVDYRVLASVWITACQKVDNIKQTLECIKTNKLFGKKNYIEENEADYRDNYKNVDDGNQPRGNAHNALQPAKEGKAAIVDNMADADDGQDEDLEVSSDEDFDSLNDEVLDSLSGEVLDSSSDQDLDSLSDQDLDSSSDEEAAAIDQPIEINEEHNAAINDGEPAEEGEPGRPQQLDINTQDELAPRPANSTVSFTSMLTLRMVRSKVFAQLSPWDQRPLRLVCKDWDKAVRQGMRHMKKVRIVLLAFGDHEWDYWEDSAGYIVSNTQDLRTLLERHENVQELMISDEQMVGDLLSDEDIASRITSLEKLEYLKFDCLSFSSKSFDILRKLPQLSSLCLNFCKLTDDNLGCLGKNIREITIEGLEESSFTPLLRAMRALHTNGIPLQKFELFSSDVTPTSLSLAQFMLENFASLRALSISGFIIEKTPAVFKPLKQVLAVNIEELDLTGISWSSESNCQQFFETLLAQPLPHLRRLVYSRSNISLEDNIVKRLWDMCPKLDEANVQHRCHDLQNLVKLYLARESFNYDGYYDDDYY